MVKGDTGFIWQFQDLHEVMIPGVQLSVTNASSIAVHKFLADPLLREECGPNGATIEAGDTQPHEGWL